MDLVLKTVVILHIISGNLALLTGTAILVLKKGNKLHQNIGKVFYYSMLLVCVSALTSAFVKELNFLFHIGLFVGYQTLAGRQSVRKKDLKPLWWEWLLLSIAAINSGFMIATFNPILLVFGFINLSLVVGGINLYYKLLNHKAIQKGAWLQRHIGMMMGSLIGVITAFLVVNINFSTHLYNIILWLSPTFILVPLLILWQRKFRMS